MSDDTSGGKPSSNKTATWIIRGVIFGALAVVLALALMDFLTKRKYEATQTAWDAAIAADGQAPKLSELKDKMEGSPTVEDEAGSGTSHTYTFTWNGIFRKYTIVLKTRGKGDDASVESMNKDQ